MRMALNLQQGRLLLLTLTFVVLFHDSFGGRSLNLDCGKCFKEITCQIHPDVFIWEAMEMGLIVPSASWKSSSIVDSHKNSACKRTNVRKIMAYLFSLSMPDEFPGCSPSNLCDMGYCDGTLYDVSLSKFAHATEKDILWPFRLKMAADMTRGIFDDVQITGNTVITAGKFVVENTEEPVENLPKLDKECPVQLQYSTVMKTKLLLKLVQQKILGCYSDYVPNDPLTGKELTHTTFLQKVLRVKIDAMLEFTTRLDLRQSFVPDLVKSKCGDYSDRYDAAKHRVTMSLFKHTLRCSQCPGNLTSENIKSWFRFGANTMFTLPLTSPNSASMLSESESYQAEALSSQLCPYVFQNMLRENQANIIAGVRNILQDVMDCRFEKCKYISQDSVEAQYFKLLYQYGCVSCIQDEFCIGQSGIDCVRKFIPSFKTPFHAVKDIAASIMQCDFELDEFAPSQVERSLSRLAKFHHILYGLSIMVSQLNVNTPVCPIDCNRANGPSPACDICDAIDIAKTISELTRKVMNCTATFTFGGERFCLAEALVPITEACPVNYTSTIQYSAIAKEVHALAFAIRALAGCPGAKTGNPSKNNELKCAYLRSALNLTSAISPAISIPEHWLKTIAFSPSVLVRSFLENLLLTSQCNSLCYPWQQYCASNRSCLPAFFNCTPAEPVPANETIPLIGHIAMDKLRSTLFPVANLANESILLKEYSNETALGRWSVVFPQQERTIFLADALGALVADSTGYLTYTSIEHDSYGVRRLHFFVPSSNSKFDRSKLHVGASVFESDYSMLSRRTAVLLILPVARSEDLKIKKSPALKTIISNNKTIYFPPISHFLDLQIEFQNHDIPRSLYPYLDKEEINLFYHFKSAYKMMQPNVKVVSISPNGTWYIRNTGQRSGNDLARLSPRDSFPVFATNLSYVPHYGYYGLASLHLNICYCNLPQQSDKFIPIIFGINIKAKNKRPIAAFKHIRFPPIAYDTSMNPNDGFNVSALSKYGSDIETPILGIMVFGVLPNKFGKWLYKLKGGDWTELKQGKIVGGGSKNLSITVVHLKPDDKIKFDLENNGSFWSLSDAKKRVKLQFTFWDMSDNKTNGPQLVKMNDRVASAYSSEVVGLMLRKGCDGVVGSMLKIDACGVCGGKGDCVACDGVPYSNASYDDCGRCTGGSTGKKRNYLQDCGNTCGKSSVDQCGICQAKAKRKDFKDCNNVCFGKAKLNDCAKCYGGSTNNTESAGKDVCGVCGGDGSRCRGCDGVANSGKVIDICGQCLHPSNITFNTNCLKLYSFTPKSSPTTGGREILVEGAGLNRYSKATCQFKRNSPPMVWNAQEVTIDAESKGKFKVTTPPADAGVHVMECTFDGSSTIIEHPINRSITFYDPSLIDIVDIKPQQLDLLTEEIQFNGTGLAQTGFMQCAYVIDGKVVLKALMTSLRGMSCRLPKLEKSAELRMTVVASLEDGELSELDKLPGTAWRNLVVYASAPSPLSAKLSNKLDSITIKFDKKIESGKKMCHEMFVGDVDAMFGRKSKCFMKGRDSVVIILGSNPRIKIGQTINIKSAVFFSYNEQFSRSNATPIVLTAPSAAVKPAVNLVGPSEVSVCGSFVLKAVVSGNTGGRNVSISWTVSFAKDVVQDVLTLEDRTGIIMIGKQLASLSDFRVRLKAEWFKPTTSQRYIAYEINVTVSNFLNDKAWSSIVVQMSNSNAPSIQIIGAKKQRVAANKNFLINARVQQSQCQASKELLLYEWQVSPPVQLDPQPQKNPRLFIQRRTLTPGTSYVFTLTVSSAADSSIFSTASVELTVDIADLVLSNKGGFYQTIGSDANVILDALTRDPDRTKERETFIWDCVDSAAMPCFTPDPQNADRMVRLILPQRKRVVIQRGKLAPNQTYTFMLTYKKGSRSSSMMKQVYISPGSPPNVKIRPLKTQKVNVKAKVVLKGYVELTKSSKTDIWWECVAGGDYNIVNISDSEVTVSKTRYTSRRGGLFMAVLVIKGNALAEGAMYRLRLSAQNNDGLGYADSIFTVNGPPSVGMFQSDISSGTALESTFTLQALQGWIDDEEDLPLTYKFGYVNEKSKDCFFGSGSLDSEIEVILPIGPLPGNRLSVFVDVFDNKGAVSRQTCPITVNPMSNFTLSTIEDLAGQVQATIETNDVSAILGRVTSTLNVFNMASDPDSPVKGVSSQVIANIVNFKERTSAAFLSMLETVFEADSQNLVLDALPDLTIGGTSFSGELRVNISQFTARFIMSKMSLQDSPPSPQPITFSLLDSDDIDVNIGKSPEEVVRIIQIYQNILNASMYDDTNMKVKRDFTNLLNALLASMCANSVFGEDASFAFTELSALQSYMYDLGENGPMNLSIGKRNWLGRSFIPGVVNLGNELALKYRNWQCTDEYKCSGICVGSVQFPQDLFSDGVIRENSTMISPAIRLNLFNPETKTLLTENQLSTPIIILVPTDTSNHKSNHTKQCNSWDEALKSWRNDSCTAEKELAKLGNDTFVVCKCFRTGTIAAFQIPVVEQLSTGGGGGGSGTGGGGGGTGGTGVTNWGANSGNITRNNPFLTLFVMIGMLSLSFSLGFGFFGYEKYKANIQLTPRDN